MKLSKSPVTVNLTRRVKTGGKDNFCPVVVSSNGRVKHGWVVIEGKEVKHETGGYYLDWTEEGKRRRIAVGKDAAEANTRWLRKQAEFRAKAEGVIVAPEEREEEGRKPMILAIADFLAELKLSRKPKTHSGYKVALGYFTESCTKQFVENVDKMDLLHFASFLKLKKKQEPRSVHNKVACVVTFLDRNGVQKLLPRGDRPKFVKQDVEVYEDDELTRLFPACSPKNVMLYRTLLMTGLREQEAVYLTWDDINFRAAIVNVRWKAGYSFDPKAYKEREVPVPDKLVTALKKYRPKDAKGSDLAFPTQSGKLETHMLRSLKREATRAGLDAEKYWLHKFRATFATSHLQAGVDLRTVQAWMGHSSLESTVRYLKPARAETVRDKVNATFKSA